MTKQISHGKYAEMVLEKTQDNHIWVSAFACVNPSPEFLRDLGATIIAKLKDENNLLPSSGIMNENKTARELAELTPYLYIGINKS